MSAEGKRFREIRKTLRLTQREFARALDKSQSLCTDIETGRKGFSFKLMRQLIQEFNINPNYIYLGHLPMFLSPDMLDNPNLIADVHTLRKENTQLKQSLAEKDAAIQAGLKRIAELEG